MKTILVAENKKEIKNLINIVFRLSGYHRIYFAKNSQACVRKARKLNPDLILLSENIQGNQNGESVLSIIKNERSTALCNVIILTEKVNKRNRRNLLRKGASDLLPLRFDPLMLMKSVEHCLGHFRSASYQEREYDVSYSQSSFKPLAYSKRI